MKQRIASGIAGVILGLYVATGANMALESNYSDEAKTVDTIQVVSSVKKSLHIPNCKHEDSHNCIWNAKKSGNGKGESFIDYKGHVYYLDECEGMKIPNPCTPDSNN